LIIDGIVVVFSIL